MKLKNFTTQIVNLKNISIELFHATIRFYVHDYAEMNKS